MPVRPDVLFLDANVLYSACCRDLLLEAALDGLCHCRWSEQVISEARTAMLRQRPELRAQQLDRLFRLMTEASPEALLKVRSMSLLRMPALVDEADGHIIRDAYCAGASVILTFNLRHFPPRIVRPMDIRAVSPDHWLVGRWDTQPERMRAVVERCRQRLRHPPLSQADHLKAIRRAGLSRFAERLEGWVK